MERGGSGRGGWIESRQGTRRGASHCDRQATEGIRLGSHAEAFAAFIVGYELQGAAMMTPLAGADDPVRPDTTHGGHGEDSLGPAQHRAVIALLEHPTVREAAEAAGGHKATVYRWLQEPQFPACATPM